MSKVNWDWNLTFFSGSNKQIYRQKKRKMARSFWFANLRSLLAPKFCFWILFSCMWQRLCYCVYAYISWVPSSPHAFPPLPQKESEPFPLQTKGGMLGVACRHFGEVMKNWNTHRGHVCCVSVTVCYAVGPDRLEVKASPLLSFIQGCQLWWLLILLHCGCEPLKSPNPQRRALIKWH